MRSLQDLIEKVYKAVMIFLPPANEVCEVLCFFMFLHLSVSYSVHRGGGGGSASVHAGIPPRADSPPPGADTYPPWSSYPLGPGTRSGPGTHPCAVHDGRYGQQAGGTHPAGMQS